MLTTAVIYFVAAAGESAEGQEGEEVEQARLNGNVVTDNDEDERAQAPEPAANDQAANEDALGTQVQTAFFVVVGLGYAATSLWAVKHKARTNLPYLVTIAGSVAIIGLYIASRTVALPIVGLQDDVGTLDILSKVMQVAIIGVSASIINSNRALTVPPAKQQRR